MIRYHLSKTRSISRAIALVMAATFVWYDIAWAGDLFYISPKTPVMAAVEKEVTNYAVLDDKKQSLLMPQVTRSNDEKEQIATFAAPELKLREAASESIIRQKQETEDSLSGILNAQINRE